MSSPCSSIDVEAGNLSSEDSKKSTKQCAHQTIPVSLNEIRPTHDSVSMIESSKFSMKQVSYYGVVGVVAVVLLIAAVLIIICMISFLSGNFCVDHGEAYDEEYEWANSFELAADSLTFGSLMFGLVGAVVGLVLLVMWNPLFPTTTHHEVGNRIQRMSGCISLSFIVDGILLCFLGGIFSVSQGQNENLKSWVWFTPYFLVGACMFALIFMLCIRNLVAPNTFSGRKQRTTAVLFMCHIILSFPFGMTTASFYRKRYCANGCMKLFSPYCTSVSEDE